MNKSPIDLNSNNFSDKVTSVIFSLPTCSLSHFVNLTMATPSFIWEFLKHSISTLFFIALRLVVIFIDSITITSSFKLVNINALTLLGSNSTFPFINFTSSNISS